MRERELLERCLQVGTRRRPTSRIVDRPDLFQVITADAKTMEVNSVVRFSSPPEAARARVAAIIAEYAALELPFRWWVAPSTTPAEMADLLAAHRPRSRVAVTGMIMDPIEPPGPLPGDPSVEQLCRANFDAYLDTDAESWGLDVGELALDLELALITPPPDYWLFLLRVAGEPAAIAGYRIVDGAAYLIGDGVRPRFRGRGLMRHLMSYRLAHAWARGCRVATAIALEATSAPILRRFGFLDVCRIEAFDFD